MKSFSILFLSLVVVAACLVLESGQEAHAKQSQWEKPFDATQWAGTWKCRRNADDRNMILRAIPGNKVAGTWQTKNPKKPRTIRQRGKHFFSYRDGNVGNILRIVAYKGGQWIHKDADRQEINFYMHRGKYPANGKRYQHISGVSRWRAKNGKVVASPVDCRRIR